MLIKKTENPNLYSQASFSFVKVCDENAIESDCEHEQEGEKMPVRWCQKKPGAVCLSGGRGEYRWEVIMRGRGIYNHLCRGPVRGSQSSKIGQSIFEGDQNQNRNNLNFELGNISLA